MKTIIMAGGKGTRISNLFPSIPKPMIKISGIPVLERQINTLKSQGLTDIIITVSHMKDKIIEHFGDGKIFDVNIEYFYEETPLGSGGAIYKLKKSLSSDFLVVNGDAIFDIDINKFYNFHKKNNALATILTHPNSHPYDSGLVIVEENFKVLKWLSKEDNRPIYYENNVNSGIHILSSRIFDSLKITDKEIIDLDRDILKKLIEIENGLFAYKSTEYVKDMGTPERFKEVENDIDRGIVSKKNIKNKQKAIFLDRDGTINKYLGFLTEINNFELLDDVSEAIKKINKSEYLSVVITNQPVIARGDLSELKLKQIHNKMETLLGSKGAYLDSLYYCPHHPDKGFENEVIELKIQCGCRKPNIGMFLMASEDLNIDLKSSWMIGDSEIDIIAGKRAGCKTILLGNMDYGQDYSCINLLEAVDYIFGLK